MKPRSTTIAIALCGMLALTALRASGQEKRLELSGKTKTAIATLRSGDAAGAERLFKAIVADPESKTYDLFMTGEFFFTELKKLDLAVNAFDKVLKRGQKVAEELGAHKYWMLFDALGTCLGMSGKLDRAEEAFQKAKALAKKLTTRSRWTSEYGLACTYAEGGKDDLAIRELNAYLRGLRMDRWKIKEEMADHLRKDNSFRNLRGNDDFERVLKRYLKAPGDSTMDRPLTLPADGRTVTLTLPETTEFHMRELPAYGIRLGGAQGTKFNFSLNRNRGSFKDYKDLAEKVFSRSSRGYAEKNKKLIHLKGMSIIWLKMQQPGMTLSQLSIRCYIQDKDLVLDFHVSMMMPSPKDEERMMRMVKSFAFVKETTKKDK